jgi:glyoxylase-like metal-dependent hydrolase (beta-lactamase superfamily II)
VRALTLGQFLRALERVAALDVAQVLPGHGRIITDHRAVAALYMCKHQRRLERFAERLGEGRVPWELTREVYPWVQGFELFLALSEVLAHLDMLVVQGLARFELGAESRYLPA